MKNTILEKGKITAEELTQQLKFAINDLFIAQSEQKDTCIVLHFANGQKFTLEVKED